jgi:cation-transporting ATPase 13A3/4/5
MTGGLMFLFSWWFVELQIWLLYSKVKPREANYLLVKTAHAEDLLQLTTMETPYGPLMVFYHRFMPFYQDHDHFEPLFFDVRISYSALIDRFSRGTVPQEVEERRRLYGKCEIIVPVKSIPRLLVEEILHPFFVFQVFSCTLWFVDGYVYYSIAIVIITTVSLSSNLYTTRHNLMKVKRMVNNEGTVRALGSGQIYELSRTNLVPGDVLAVDSNTVMPCDAVLLQGNCVMEEGMLTGESVPVLKDALPHLSDVLYDIERDKRFSLYEGTKVIQSRGPAQGALALVTRTGYQTLKGKLVRTILFPKPNQFKFYRDSLYFVAVLAGIALLGFLCTLPKMLSHDFDISYLIRRSLDLLTIAVPPALPAAMAAGTTFALKRLTKLQIFCVSPPRVNVAGKVEVMLFDKTGTLTEDGMDLLGVQHEDSFSQMEPEAYGLLCENMASCHSLTEVNGALLGDTQDLKIFQATGWQFELQADDTVMAIVRPYRKGRASSKSALKEPKFSEEGDVASMMLLPNEVGILHVFHFTSNLKRMGVIVKNLQDETFRLHVKGAPEVVSELCVPESIPHDFKEVLSKYTQLGYRVLACATKTLPEVKFGGLKGLSLKDVEKNLSFLGLIVLQNKLKAETIPALNSLREAEIGVKMATGDNVLTGVAVGRECGIIPKFTDVFLCEVENGRPQWTHLAYAALDAGDDSLLISTKHSAEMPWLNRPKSYEFVLASTGEAFAYLVDKGNAAVVEALVTKGTVFARMAPEHKTLLVEQLQQRKKLVGMCGDGANDCGALKTADVGVSLSEAEASIAAPFTSRISNISCILTVLKEGRCALTTSLQEFKFMALYSMIQFSSVTILYLFAINLTDMQFLIIDLFMILPLALCMSYTGPYHLLSKEQPTGTLMSVAIMSSVIGQTIFAFSVQLLSIVLLSQQSFYTEVNVGDATDKDEVQRKSYAWENSTIFMTSLFAYLTVCVVFSIGRPFKQPAYTNLYISVTLALCTAVTFYLAIYPADWARHIFYVKPFPELFRLELIGLGAVYFLIAYCYEKFAVPALYAIDKRRRQVGISKVH